MKDNKNLGFTIVETLIVSVFVASVLILLYTQISRVEDSYGRSFTYNTTESLYSAEKIKDFLVNEKNDVLKSSLEGSTKGYIDLTDCADSVYQNDVSQEEFCNMLYSSLNVKKVLLISSNINAVYGSLKTHRSEDNISESLIKFVNSIKKVSTGAYLVFEYNNHTFTSVYISGMGGEVVEPLAPGADGANVPTLNTNMVAVEIDDSGNLTVADTSNTNWYNYNESKWANVVVMKD